MAVFGLVRLEHIPPQEKNEFRGVWVGPGVPVGAFSHNFRIFKKKSLNRFMKEVEIEYSVFKTNNIFV